MKEIDKNLTREQLRVKMCELQDEAFQYRREIERIDKQNDKQKYEQLLNKCFLTNGYEYFRIDGYDENYEMYGIVIYDYSKDLEGSYTINLKRSIWEPDDIKNSIPIPNDVFENKLKEAISKIKI